MFNNDKRRPVASINTLIAEGTIIRGDVHFSGGLHLEGQIEGTLSAEGADALLTMSDKGQIKGEVRVPNAVINGHVSGDLFIGERLELGIVARVDGNVHYKVLEMAGGAQVNGKVMFQSEPPRRLAAPEATPELANGADDMAAHA